MKKLFFLFVAAGLIVSQAANSQDKNVLNHVALGVGVGTDGLGVNIALPLGNHLQVRGGYSTMQPVLGLIKVEGVPVTDVNLTLPVSYHDHGMNIDKLELVGATQFNHANLLFDFLPSENSGFHLTFGGYFGFGNLAHGVGKAVDNTGANGISQSDWANTAFYGITTNTSGEVVADAKFLLNSFKPYLGIGFGRPVSLKHRVGFNFDMGLMMTGGLHLYSYNFRNNPDGDPVELNTDWVESYDDLKNQMARYESYFDLMNSVIVWPLLKLSIFVRLF